MLLALWGEAIYRPTRDLDFTGYGSSLEDDVRTIIREVCAVQVADDGIAFDGEAIRIEPTRDQDEYDGLRARFEATLDNAQIPVQIDVGFGNAIEPPPTDEHYPVLLDAPHPQIRVYPREAVVAEKLHAMVVLGERNSRYKDFYDLYALAQQFEFSGERLGRAIGATFERRHTPVTQRLPVALTPRFYADIARADEWASYRNRNNLPGVPSDFNVVGDRIREFLVEPWEMMARGAVFMETWPPKRSVAASIIGLRELCEV